MAGNKRIYNKNIEIATKEYAESAFTAAKDLANANLVTAKAYTDEKVAPKQDILQYETLPLASEENEGRVYQYIGETNSNYTQGYFYQVISEVTEESGEEITTYSYVNIDVQDQPPIKSFHWDLVDTTVGKQIYDLVKANKPVLVSARIDFNRYNIPVYTSMGISGSASLPNEICVFTNSGQFASSNNALLTCLKLWDTNNGSMSNFSYPWNSNPTMGKLISIAMTITSTGSLQSIIGVGGPFPHPSAILANYTYYGPQTYSSLSTKNTTYYAPTDDFHPATKNYTETARYDVSISGYDASVQYYTGDIVVHYDVFNFNKRFGYFQALQDCKGKSPNFLSDTEYWKNLGSDLSSLVNLRFTSKKYVDDSIAAIPEPEELTQSELNEIMGINETIEEEVDNND